MVDDGLKFEQINEKFEFDFYHRKRNVSFNILKKKWVERFYGAYDPFELVNSLSPFLNDCFSWR